MAFYRCPVCGHLKETIKCDKCDAKEWAWRIASDKPAGESQFVN